MGFIAQKQISGDPQCAADLPQGGQGRVGEAALDLGDVPDGKASLFCYENLPSEGRNNPSCPRTGCLHYRKHGFRRSQAGYQAPNPALSDVLDIHVFFCLD